VRQLPTSRILRGGAVLFAAIALAAGGLQFAAYLHAGWLRHLVAAIFASAVGATVLIAVFCSRAR
jgi:hypothetical protein